MPYRVLVVAPSNPDLLMLNDEVMQVVNALGARLLQGARANVHGLIDMLREGWDIVWFASHGDERGVYLSDGIVNASEITSLIRSAGVVLTVFNTCSSYEVAHAIHGELKTAFVCTVKPLPDRTAYVTGALFAQKIAEGLDFGAAYDAAKPGQNSTYIFLGAKGRAMPPTTKPGHDTSAAAVRFEEIVEQLDAIVNGNPRLRIVGLADLVDSIVKRIASLDERMAKVEDEQKFNRRLLIALFVILTFVLIALVIAVFVQGGAA